MAKSRKMSVSMMRASDPRMAIAGAYDDMKKYKAEHLIPEFEDKLNNIEGPGQAFSLSGSYSRKAKEHFDAGHDGAKA
jgi:hypothetical protein